MDNTTDAKTEDLEFPNTGRIAAVDYGTVRIGIALCDPDWILASPHEVHQAQSPEEDADYFVRLAREERLAGFVVGLPIHCDGGESQKSTEARRYARWLSDTTSLPVRLFDERFSTAAANQKLLGRSLTRGGKKKRLDAVAAQVLLESFLESCRYHGTTAGQSPFDEANGEKGLDD